MRFHARGGIAQGGRLAPSFINERPTYPDRPHAKTNTVGPTLMGSINGEPSNIVPVRTPVRLTISRRYGTSYFIDVFLTRQAVNERCPMAVYSKDPDDGDGVAVGSLFVLLILAVALGFFFYYAGSTAP
jgi:hypothetical protein